MKKRKWLILTISIILLFTVAIYCITLMNAQGSVPIHKNGVLLTQDLDENSSGKQVAILQAGLKSASFYPNIISGFYTYSTQEAVRGFQTRYLLPITGKMDFFSRIKFNELFGMRSADKLLGEYVSSGTKWGIAKKVEGTRYGWSMKIENDFHMSSMKELFDALNVYRVKKGKAKLILSERLTSYAESRAEFLIENGGVDDHVGFRQFSRNPQNREGLGFVRLGENTSCGYHVTGTHMIEWVFAGDAPHDDNQLSERWSHVGIGIVEDCVSLVFGR